MLINRLICIKKTNRTKKQIYIYIYIYIYLKIYFKLVGTQLRRCCDISKSNKNK